MEIGIPGEEVGIMVNVERGLLKGDYLAIEDEVRLVEEFIGHVVVMNCTHLIGDGYTPVMSMGNVKVRAKFEKILGLIDRASGRELVMRGGKL